MSSVSLHFFIRENLQVVQEVVCCLPAGPVLFKCSKWLLWAYKGGWTKSHDSSSRKVTNKSSSQCTCCCSTDQGRTQPASHGCVYFPTQQYLVAMRHMCHCSRQEFALTEVCTLVFDWWWWWGGGGWGMLDINVGWCTLNPYEDMPRTLFWTRAFKCSRFWAINALMRLE